LVDEFAKEQEADDPDSLRLTEEEESLMNELGNLEEFRPDDDFSH